ncbi:NAD(P)H-binding protein [Macrococcoides canis]|uniref:NAD(P)H-binding protein n=1 Tax=Macrococcoides canis TaxID=1855823 RepID=UPI0039C98A4C
MISLVSYDFHLFRLFTYKIYRNKEAQNQLIKQSNLTYTIIQPPTLTNKIATCNYRHGNYKHKNIFEQLSRADLAHFMLKNFEDNRYLNEIVYVQQ